MTIPTIILTLELPAELYEGLRLESVRRGETMQTLAQKLLAERLPSYVPVVGRTHPEMEQ